MFSLDDLTTVPLLEFAEKRRQFIIDAGSPNSAIIVSREGIFKTWKSYCTTKKELLATVKAVEYFHFEIYGRNVQIGSEHGSL